MGFVKQFSDQSVYELALARMRRVFDEYDTVSVMFSGGKDSTACLNIAMEAHTFSGRPEPLDVVFFDEESLHPPTVEYLERVARLPQLNFRWLCVPIQHRNACSIDSPYWYPWAPEDRSVWVREMPKGAINYFPGYAGMTTASERLSISELTGYLYPRDGKRIATVLGIRATESIRRYRSVTFRAEDNWISRDKSHPMVAKVKPVYDWSTEDVWVAPHKFGWDYNRTYDVFTKLGVSAHDQRVCPPFGEEPLRGLWMYAQAWPELWEKMCARVPGASTAGRYSRSPLYAFGDRQKLPEGVTYQQQIESALLKWPTEDGTRQKVAAHLKRIIDWHYRRFPKMEIPEHTADNPQSTVSWDMLLMVATRGDFKERKMPSLRAENLSSAGQWQF